MNQEASLKSNWLLQLERNNWSVNPLKIYKCEVLCYLR